MNYAISTITHVVPQDTSFMLDFLDKLKISDYSLVFFSSKCYERIKLFSTYNNQTLYPPFSKNFYQKGTDTYVNFSFVKLSSADWVFLECLRSNSLTHYHKDCFPDKIVFISYEDEFEKKSITFDFLLSDCDSSPVDPIMYDIPEFKKSMFFLTDTAYNSLKKTVSTHKLYSYKGIERFLWLCDDRYPGGTLILRPIIDNLLYFVEDLSFPHVNTVLNMRELPDHIYIILK